MKTGNLLAALLLCSLVRAQNIPPSGYLDISKITDSAYLGAQTGYWLDNSKSETPQTVLTKTFKPFNAPEQTRRYIGVKQVNKPIYVKLQLFNGGSNSDTIYFYPGMRFRFETFQVREAQAVPMSSGKTANEGYVELILPPGASGEYLVKLKPEKRDDNRFNPQLMQKHFLRTHGLLLKNRNVFLDNLGMVLSGILLTMIIFTLITYFSNFKKEFLYYCGYATCNFLLIFLLAIFYMNRPTLFANFLMSYLSFALLISGTVFYSGFTRWFLETRDKYKTLDRLFRIQEFVLLSLLVIYSGLHFFTDSYYPQYLIENGTKILALGIGVAYLVIAYKARKDWLMKYLAVGNAAYIFFSLISLVVIWLTIKKITFLGSPLMYLQIGIVLAIITFLYGLSEKNRRNLIATIQEQEALKRLAETKELESQLAVLKAQQDERNRISADMHDDLGAGMTAIRLYSELAKAKTKKNPILEIDKISYSANDLLNKMNAIIWTMNSSNDTLSNLVAYLRSYALEYFDGTPTSCSIDLPETLPDAEVPGDMRRNIFLVFKEVLNNVVKHANATKVSIKLQNTDGLLELFIHDNGSGIDMDNLREFGNGLKNMRRRMDEIGVEFEIKKQDGTLVTLRRRITAPPFA